jgi:ectoine hydroxylase-related dioxygenase (phytanoyl-CoA dioxygenase family)
MPEMIAGVDIDSIVTPAVVDEYWTRGYWISPTLLDDAQIAAARAAHDRLWSGDLDANLPSQYGLVKVEPASPKVRQQCNAFWVNQTVREIVTHPVIGAIAARLMRVPTVCLWHDQAIYKPGVGTSAATEAGNIGWHQDYGFWKASNTTNMITAWIALQDTDLRNGGMRTIVGSHKWGLIEDSDTFFEQDLQALAAKFSQHGEWIDEPCVMKAGQVSFHHALTFHGSGANQTDAPRLSLVAHLMPGDTGYRAGAQWHPNVVFLGPNAHDGQPFTGDYFPQVYPPES